MATSRDALRSLHPGLQRWITQEAGWSGLTPIQTAAIPVILSGEDCVIEAPTAGGKTEAVLFPALTRAVRQTAEGGLSAGVRLLYLAPLRALLNNLENRGERYAEACGLTAFKWHGDVAQKAKSDAMRSPPDLLMTTPESLEAMLLRRGDWPQLFSALIAVILDEAHNFAAGDRGGHLLSLMERVQAASTGPQSQRIAMSATLGNPAAMLGWLAGPRRQRGRRIHVDSLRRTDRDYRILFFSAAGEDEDTPPQERASYRRFADLHRILRGDGDRPARSLVFVRSRRGAESVATGLVKLDAGLPNARHLEIRTHHSAVSKFFREDAEQLIQVASEDGIDAIVSTSTLELGIDIGALDRIVQMDALGSPSSFLQRVGRTGRRPGKPSFFRGLLDEEDDLPVLAATVRLGLQGRCEALLLPTRAFHLLAHQLICLALQSFGVDPNRAWQTISGAHCFSAIDRAEFDHLVAHMVAAGYLRRVDGVLVAGPTTEEQFLHSNWRRLFAVFATAPLYEVHHRHRAVGTLDVAFVESLEVPFFFVLGGKLWRADKIDIPRRRVLATPSRSGDAPRWTSFGGPDIPFETAQEAGRLLHGAGVTDFLDAEAQDTLALLQRRFGRDGWKPGRIVMHVRAGGSADLVTYAGDRINRTLARLLTVEGVGKATADYRQVTVVEGADERADLRRDIRACVSRLRQQPLAERTGLARHLAQTQKLYPFSPFARCLPPDLWAMTLVAQSLDPEGLLRLVGEAERTWEADQD